MTALNLRINGRWVSAQPGQTILDAARAHGIFIPTLCDFPGLPSHGSCRMCIVEVQGVPNTPTACTTPVSDGMLVETESAHLRELRDDLLRMLLAEHPAACLFCPEKEHCAECMVTLRKAGVTTGCRSCPADRQCTLQEMVERSGLQSVAYPARYRALPVEKGDPFFDRDYNLCVLCGRCIRACETLHFTHIPTYVNRGSQTRVGTSFGLSHLEAGCAFCGACVDVCPTGALWDKTRKWDGPPDGEVRSTCPLCSLGCELRLLVRDGAVIGALPGQGLPALCVKGRFGIPELVNHPDRLKHALRIEHGAAVQVSWDEACQLAAQRLANCAPGDFALVASASCSSEDLAVAHKFTRQVMRSDAAHISAAARYGRGLGAAARLLALSQPLEALDTAGLIFCLGLDAAYAQSVVEPYLLRARARGAVLLTLNAHQHVPGRFADLWLKPPAGGEAALLAELAAGQDGNQVGAALGLLRAASRPLLLVGPGYLADLPQAVERLQAATGAGLVALAAEGNLGGTLRTAEFGAQSAGFGGAPPAPAPRALYLVGAALPPELDPETFVIFQNTHLPPGGLPPSLRDGLVLPMAAFCEAGGSLVDHAGALKQLSAAVAPPGDALPGWEIVCRIARAMGAQGFDFSSAGQVSAELARQAAVMVQPDTAPGWLACPDEHDFMGAPLAAWVGGLRDLEPDSRDPQGVLRDPTGVLRDPQGVLRDPAGVLRDPTGVLRDPTGVLREEGTHVPLAGE